MVDAFQNEGGLASTAPRPVRKKFAKPPVKVACLPWYASMPVPRRRRHQPGRGEKLTVIPSRASRTRCGGQEPCSNVCCPIPSILGEMVPRSGAELVAARTDPWAGRSTKSTIF